MKAAVNTRYGSPDVVEIREVPKPVPKAGEILVKVHATTLSRTDCGMLRAHPFFLRRRPGADRQGEHPEHAATHGGARRADQDRGLHHGEGGEPKTGCKE